MIEALGFSENIKKTKKYLPILSLYSSMLNNVTSISPIQPTIDLVLPFQETIRR